MRELFELCGADPELVFSPYCWRVRLALAHKGLDWQSRPIRFTDKEPRTAWNRAAPQEYGFYSNVNPQVSHPRWSQATERRIGEEGGLFAKRRQTQMFNGYEPQVGQLYAGMDLRKFF